MQEELLGFSKLFGYSTQDEHFYFFVRRINTLVKSGRICYTLTIPTILGGSL